MYTEHFHTVDYYHSVIEQDGIIFRRDTVFGNRVSVALFIN